MAAASTPTIPRSFLACLPFVWSGVLFSGANQDNANLSWRHLVILFFLPALLLYPCLSFYLLEPDEGRYAEIPREMLLGGEWIVPLLQGDPYLDKPPLLYWIVMVSYSIFGIHDWAARLVPALAVHGTILLVYLLGARALGEKAAFRAALLLTLTPGLLGVGRLLTMDGLLTLWVTLGVLAAFEATRTPVFKRGWWLTAALACGLGLMTKGPIALVLVLAPLWLHRRLTRSGATLKLRDWVFLIGIAIAFSLPWYAALCLSNPEFSGHFLWEHNVLRFVQPFDHLEPVWYYVPLLAVALLPALPLLIPFARYVGTGDVNSAKTRSPEFGFFLLAGGWCVMFFSFSGCKLPTYILPALPFLSLSLGHFMAHSDWRNARSLKYLAVAGLTLQLLAHFVLVPWYADYRSPMQHWPTLAQHCGDPELPVICYPRPCNSVAFYLGRDDMISFRSKDIDQLRLALRQNPKTVLLLSHRHSFAALSQVLPPEFEICRAIHFGLAPAPGLPKAWGQRLIKPLGETALGLADLAVVAPCRNGELETAKQSTKPNSEVHYHPE